ncbi:MAG TPA: hypothetical protein VFZ78_03395 [Flavisolibacter sp.]
MNLKTTLLVILCICGLKSYAQDRQYRLLLSPALIGFDALAVQPGCEVQLSERFAIVLETLVPVKKFDTYRELQIARVRLESKYYYKPAIKNEREYFGFDISYLRRRLIFQDSNWYYDRDLKSDVHFTSGMARSHVLAAAFTYGIVTYMKKFHVDLSGGAGCRVIFTRYSINDPVITPAEFPFSPMAPVPSTRLNGDVYRFHLIMRIRIGYLI